MVRIIFSVSEAIQKAMKLKDIYGSPFRFWIMQKPFIVISAPEDFEVRILHVYLKSIIQEEV